MLGLRTFILVGVLSLAQAAAAEPKPKTGLLWQNTGLPAVFPLIVKTNPGLDYYLRLHAVDIGEARLAAFATGGAFFKVLVPPGTYRMRVAIGTHWQDESTAFGPETRWLDLPDPLTFEVEDFSTKRGHMVDLRGQEESEPVIEARFICQKRALVALPRPLPPFEDDAGFAVRLTGPGVLLRYPGSYFDPLRLGNADRPALPTDFAPYFSPPEFGVRARAC